MIRAAALTVIIETSLFFLMGYRRKRFLAVAALSNLLTNVTLNLTVLATVLLCELQGIPGLLVYAVIAAGEAGAVAAEYIIYEKYIENNESFFNNDDSGTAGRTALQKRVLFLQVLFANTVSFSTGYLLSHFGVGGFGSGII